jgi:hypothetical protein
MWWLFGQLWLWLFAAFALGAATSLLLTRDRRTGSTPPVPTEETRQLPPSHGEYAEPGPQDDTGQGRWSGTLPLDWPPTS